MCATAHKHVNLELNHTHNLQAQLAICVGNAQPEVAAWARTQPAAQPAGGGGAHANSGPAAAPAAATQDGVGAATPCGAGGGGGGKRVHLASADKHAAAGVMEGLAALGFM